MGAPYLDVDVDARLYPLTVCGLCLTSGFGFGATNPPPPSLPPPCGGMFAMVGIPPEPSVPEVAPPCAFPNCA
jgi:hypothetical protein